MSVSIETKCLHLEEKIENAEGECKSLQDEYYEIDFEDFESKEYIWENILYAENYIRDHSPKIKVIKPEGSYLLWLDFSGLDLPNEEINHRILQKAKSFRESTVPLQGKY